MPSYVTKSLRVYLVDDHDIVRRGLRDLLVLAEDINVVGDSGSAQEAARAIPTLGVDVMLLDLRLQDGTGVEVCREVRSVSPSTAGLLLTSSGDDEALVAAILAGAAGYLIKLTHSSEITAAIRRIGAGRPLLDPAVVERVGHQLLGSLDELRPPPTERERVIVRHVLGGLTNSQVADQMGISPDRATAEITPLLRRLTDPASAPPAEILAPPGRHRRPDR